LNLSMKWFVIRISSINDLTTKK